MEPFLITVIAMHVLSSVFWAGTTFVLARTGANDVTRLFRPQLGAAVIAIISGALLWSFVHAGAFGNAEMLLALGSGTALAALVIQAVGVLRGLRATGQAAPWLGLLYRISAGLLFVTVICMAVSRYV
ncbi:hypothetical protein AB4099_03740 [Bosea sp. 2KB_26]|uniref:hypothetical protein n=1 Tax=Bosea sp. 2KB_26 TaxID=3237475 RepID=UPI003F8DAA34